MRAIGALGVALAFGIGMYFVGWLTVPLIGALYGAVRRHRGAPQDAMLGAMLASLSLLVPQMVMPTFSRLLEQLGAIFPLPGIAVLALTVLLSMVLAFTSARVAIGVVGTRDPRVVGVDPATGRLDR